MINKISTIHKTTIPAGLVVWYFRHVSWIGNSQVVGRSVYLSCEAPPARIESAKI